MAEDDRTGKVERLEIPKGVGVYKLTRLSPGSFYDRREIEEALNFDLVPDHALRDLQLNIDWMAKNMGQHPECSIKNGYNQVLEDNDSPYTRYLVRKSG